MKAASTLDHLAFVVTVSVGLLAHRTEVALVSKLVAVCTAGEGIVPQGRLVLEGKGGEGRGGEGRRWEGRRGGIKQDCSGKWSRTRKRTHLLLSAMCLQSSHLWRLSFHTLRT